MVQYMTFEVLIRNGKIIDGCGNPWVRGDLGINQGRITKLGRLNKDTAPKEIDATGKIVCPGFIDIHSHSDFALPFDPHLESSIRQGITTSVVGQCGDSMAPVNPEREDMFLKLSAPFTPPGEQMDITWHSFGEYLTEIENTGFSTNIITVVGFGTVRIAGGPGYEEREPTPEELETMKEYVAEAMEVGAFGLSTGLIYTPQIYSKTEEVIELAKTASKYNGLYFSHIRGEGSMVIEAIKEVIHIVERSGCSGAQIAHMKVTGKANWGLSKETLRLISEANARGLNITGDQYPYERSMTSLITTLPPWVHLGGVPKIVERLQNLEDQKRIKKDIMEGMKVEGFENMIAANGWDRLYIATVKTEQNRQYEGKSLAEITQLKRNPDEFTTLFDILVEEDGEVGITVAGMAAEDIERIMADRYTMIATDGWGVSTDGILGYGKPHPRFYGTYPRVLGHYVREKGILTWEEAIRKMTSFPAQKLELWDRGLLREGCWADIVIFDPKSVIDKATFENPHQYPEGVSHVLVNGEPVIENEQYTGKMPGELLKWNK